MPSCKLHSKEAIEDTRQMLAEQLNSVDDKTKHDIIAGALVILYNNQTAVEKRNDKTAGVNCVGFQKVDARFGSIAARNYIQHGSISLPTVSYWSRVMATGLPRLCKHAAQLVGYVK